MILREFWAMKKINNPNVIKAITTSTLEKMRKKKKEKQRLEEQLKEGTINPERNSSVLNSQVDSEFSFDSPFIDKNSKIQKESGIPQEINRPSPKAEITKRKKVDSKLTSLDDSSNEIQFLSSKRKRNKPNEKEEPTIHYIAMEYASKGELFTYLNIGGGISGFSEKIARVQLMQMLEAVQACHLAKICHKDIKIDNFVLDDDYNIKLIDFGYSKNLINESYLKYGFFLLPKGRLAYTEGYIAPEMLEDINIDRIINGIKADIFALGVTFYAFVTGKYILFPYKHDSKGNYPSWENFLKCKGNFAWNYLKDKNKNDFWKLNPEINDKLSNEFKNLIWKMICYDPNERVDIENLMKDPFFNGEKATKEMIVEEYELRRRLLNMD